MKHTVPLNRALSKLGILSRAQATVAIRAGRVRVDGHVVDNPYAPTVPESARITIDQEARTRAAWRTILFHKSRGAVTTRQDPEGRPTIYDVLGDDARGMIAVGRLDRATTGLLMLTSDTQLAHWVTDPANAVPRVYIVTVRGRVTAAELAELGDDRKILLRKTSARESHLTIELTEGKNRQVRRLFDALGHEVTRLKRVRLGGLELGDLQPAAWRDVTARELRGAFPDAPIRI